jgi:glycosyltransferase involved in cell wall biosynthesis
MVRPFVRARPRDAARKADMKFLHVVSAFTPDNRFGGPTRGAVGLAQELERRGHEVVLVGAALDYDRLPDEIDGVRARLVRGVNPTPALGWASLLAPGLVRVLREELQDTDVAHVHLARDVVTLTAALTARRAGVPYVVQTHGMIDAAGGPLGRAVDLAATRRAVRGAAVALPLTPDEQEEVTRLSGGRLRARTFPNGIGAAPTGTLPQPGVLFLARLHPRKGASAFARAAADLAAAHPSARFTIAGPDEGDRAAVDAIVSASPDGDRIAVIGAQPPETARLLLAGCTAYVLPAEREPFGMTVIEAMGAGRPVVLHAGSTLAPEVVAAGAGWSFGPGGTHPDLRSAIAAVLDDPDAVEAAGRRAAELVRERYSIQHVVDLLIDRYREALTSRS